MNNQLIIERYYRAHKDEMIAFVSARLHNPDIAKDVVQDVFLRLLSDYPATGTTRLISEITLPALAYTFCRHLIADWYRRHSVRDDAEHELAQSIANSPSAESLLSVREITEQLEHGLARLPENCREIYRLHIYGGMKANDICQLTGEKYKAVEYRLGLARKHIRNYFRHIS